MAAGGFYVYVHKRPDTGAIFYVGKGRGYRYSSKCGRSAEWWRIFEQGGGLIADKVAFCESEELAFLAEIELIDQQLRLGVELCNKTKGGGGYGFGAIRTEEYKRKLSAALKGRRQPNISLALRGIPKSSEHRANLSKARKGVTASNETKSKMSAARRGRPSTMLGKTHSETAKRKIGDAQRGEKNHWYGKKLPDHVIEACIAANTGRVESDETRRRKSEAHKGPKNHRFGKHVPEEQKARQAATLKARPKIECPHCGIICDEANAKRWHMDNCRSK